LRAYLFVRKLLESVPHEVEELFERLAHGVEIVRPHVAVTRWCDSFA
jgi:hypothetical protein